MKNKPEIHNQRSGFRKGNLERVKLKKKAIKNNILKEERNKEID